MTSSDTCLASHFCAAYARTFVPIPGLWSRYRENRCFKNCTGDEANGIELLINAAETFIHFYRADEKVVAAEG